MAFSRTRITLSRSLVLRERKARVSPSPNTGPEKTVHRGEATSAVAWSTREVPVRSTPRQLGSHPAHYASKRFAEPPRDFRASRTPHALAREKKGGMRGRAMGTMRHPDDWAPARAHFLKQQNLLLLAPGTVRAQCASLTRSTISDISSSPHAEYRGCDVRIP